MKKQLHILEGFIILVVVFIAFLLVNRFIYKISHEVIDTTYMWNISYDNLDIVEGSKGNVTYTQESLSLDVTLMEFNEFSEFSIDIVNKGMIDAILDDYVLNVESLDNILVYTILYVDGREINKGDILKANSSDTIHVRIIYPEQEKKIYDALSLKLSLEMHYKAYY